MQSENLLLLGDSGFNILELSDPRMIWTLDQVVLS